MTMATLGADMADCVAVMLVLVVGGREVEVEAAGLGFISFSTKLSF